MNQSQFIFHSDARFETKRADGPFESFNDFIKLDYEGAVLTALSESLTIIAVVDNEQSIIHYQQGHISSFDVQSDLLIHKHSTMSNRVKILGPYRTGVVQRTA